MNKHITVYATVAALVLGTAGLAIGKIGSLNVTLSPCGSTTGVCSPTSVPEPSDPSAGTTEEEAYANDTTVESETNSWGDAESGGIVFVTKDYYYFAEWGKGYYVVDTGTSDGTSSSTDYYLQ